MLKLVQMLIVIAVSGTAAHYEVTKNNFLIGVWGVIAAIAFTMAYARIADWLTARRNANPLQ